MHARRGASAGVFAILLFSLVGVALAQQPRGRAGAAKPKPKPAPTAAATGDDDNPYANPVPGSQAPAGASTLDGGPVPAPPPRVDFGEGGVKPSPLNPAAAEMPPTTPPAATASAIDYDKVLGDVAALRARVAAVGDSLFVARVALLVETDGSHARIGKLTVALDDGVVYSAPASFRADDPTPIYEHAVAPGRHSVTVDVDRRDDRDESFKDSQHARFVVDVPPDNRLTVFLRLGDDSDMGKNFPSDKSGKYDLRVRIKASASPVNVKR